MSIVDNIARVQDTIATACARANRDPSTVTLVAVSKTKPIEMVCEAVAAGVQHFGENRVEESQQKIPLVNQQLEHKPTWHMIGHIQSRKAKLIPPLFDVIHSIDSLKLARKLSQLAVEDGQRLDVLLEINISGEEAKYGFEASGWKMQAEIKDSLWKTVGELLVLPGLNICGLMTMAPYLAKAEATRPVFADLAELADTLSTAFAVELPHLSMGMTNDYPVAIEEGATIVRVGRAIFGERD